MLTIRKGLPEDESFLVEHAYRLVEFGPPSWRGDQGPMTQTDIKHIKHALLSGAFEKNTHARKVYEKAGYKQEWIKYLKEL